MRKYNDFVITTASSIDGYRIIEQCGIVFGETVFKHGFLSRLGAGLSDIVDTVSWGSREMSGSMSLIEEARQYAYDKMVREARNRGANAIIAIDSDNTIGGDIMYISLYGTAVRVVSEQDYQNQIIAEKEAAAQKEAKKKQWEDQLKQRRASGEYAQEDELLSEIEQLDSLMKIWQLWQSSGLDAKYPGITSQIKGAKESERMYGKMEGDVRIIKKMISDTFYGKERIE